MFSLAHKGLDFEERPLPFTVIPTVEDGFSKTVPILRDGDRLVSDSFEIALYLDEAYPERPSLFDGEGGKAMARFVESWSQTQLHPAIVRIAVLDIHNMLDEPDRRYFRESRTRALGRPLEDVVANREDEIAAFPALLAPIRRMLSFQPFIGGTSPLFRITSFLARCNGRGSPPVLICFQIMTLCATGSKGASIFTMQGVAV